MSKRKTLKIDEIVSVANDMLAKSICSEDHRQGMIGLLERLLFYANQYKGFQYLRDTEVPPDHLPGITGFYPENHTFPDETRRRYNG